MYEYYLSIKDKPHWHAFLLGYLNVATHDQNLWKEKVGVEISFEVLFACFSEHYIRYAIIDHAKKICAKKIKERQIYFSHTQTGKGKLRKN